MAKRTIDLAAVREARKRLREIAKEHPELTGPSGPKNRASWEAALKESERMSPNTPVTAFRLPVDLLERIDDHAALISKQAGVPVSRAAAVVKLLTERLDELDIGKKKSKK